MKDEGGSELMAENLETGLHDAHVLAERLYRLQKEQSDAMMIEIRDHTSKLNQVVTDVAVIKGQTSDLPDVKRRVGILELKDSKKEGMGAAAVMLIQAGWAVLIFLALHFIKW